MKQRCAFVGTVGQRPAPRCAQRADVVLVNLLEGAEPLAVVTTTPCRPLARWGAEAWRRSRVCSCRADSRPPTGRQHGIGRQAAARPACGAWQQHRSELIDITRQLCGAGDQLILRHEIREQVGVLLGAERARAAGGIVSILANSTSAGLPNQADRNSTPLSWGPNSPSSRFFP